MSAPFDASALTAPVDAATLKAHRASLAASGRLPGSTMSTGLVVVLVVVGVIAFATLSGAFTLFAAVGSSIAGSGWSMLISLVPLALVVGIGLLVTVIMISFARRRRERGYRLDRFAAANGMTWYAESRNPPLPGLIFGQGRDRMASDLVRGTVPRFVEFANYRYTTGSGKNQTTHKWGYVAIKLSTPLPHIVLDAVGNNGLFGSNLPRGFDKEQRLGLEGDFDRFFALYCPVGYERDALYLFTPDIMARFIDHAAQLDVEIVDDWLFLYSRRDFSTLDPQMWAWLFSVVGALLGKLAQWERWRDDRLAVAAAGMAGADAVASGSAAGAAVGAPIPGDLPFTPPELVARPPAGVAPEGRRLKTRVPWATIVIGSVLVVVWLVSQSGVLSLLFR